MFWLDGVDVSQVRALSVVGQAEVGQECSDLSSGEPICLGEECSHGGSDVFCGNACSFITLLNDFVEGAEHHLLFE